MKRSEMIDILYQELLFWNNSNSKYKQVASPLKEELAEMLLETIEQAGMEPPTYPTWEGAVEYNIPEWETEDE